MIPKIIKNFNIFVDGIGYAGKVDEVTLPKLAIKTEEYRAGGMDAPVDIDMGMEKLEAELSFAEYDTELFKSFGLLDGNIIKITLRGAMQGDGKTEAVIINLRGIFKEIDTGSWKSGDKTSLKCTISCRYYKLTIDDNELIEINVENMKRVINGVDQLEKIRDAIGV